MSIQLITKQTQNQTTSQWLQAQQNQTQNQTSTAYHQASVEQTPYVTGQIVDGVQIGSETHKNMWERGQIEYTGRDSFSNIQAHLDNKLQAKK